MRKRIKVKNKFRLAKKSRMSRKRMAPSVLPKGRQRISPRIDLDDISSLTKSQIDLELAKMFTMTPEEAAAVAAQALAEAEAAVAQAEEAMKEAEEAEAEAVAFEVAIEMMKRYAKKFKNWKFYLCTRDALTPCFSICAAKSNGYNA